MRSRSPKGRRRSTSRDRRGPNRRTDRRRSLSKSRSPRDKGRPAKRKSHSHHSHSTSPKRRRSSSPGVQKHQRQEAPQRREADSTYLSKKRRSSSPLRPESSSAVQKERRHGDGAGRRNAAQLSRDPKDGSSRTDLEKGSSTKSKQKDKGGKKRSSEAAGQKSSKHHSGSSRKHKREKKQNDEMEEEEEEEEDQGDERPYDQTDKTLDERFSQLVGKIMPFVPDENVTIEIERAVLGHAVPFAIPPFWSGAVQIARHADEGKKPFSEREEFLRRVEDSDDEQRTVKVKKRTLPENFDVRSDRIRSRNQRRGRDIPSRSHGEGVGRRAEERGARRLEERGAYRENIALVVSTRGRGGRRRPVQRSVMRAPSGRPFLLPAAAAMTGNLHQDTMPRTSFQQYESAAPKLMNLNLQSGFRSGVPPAAEPPALPDFAHRPGKYSYEEWKDRPELIPKGRSYYEHDDRDAEGDRWGSRFRGRGAGGGRFPRGGGRMRRRLGRQDTWSDSWKHDKFYELEGDQPTSSTLK